MSEFDNVFIVGPQASGNLYAPKFIQSKVGQQVFPSGFSYRKADPRRTVLVTINGNHIPLSLFSEHPSARQLLPLARSIV